jgi:hypothetical protein
MNKIFFFLIFLVISGCANFQNDYLLNNNTDSTNTSLTDNDSTKIGYDTLTNNFAEFISGNKSELYFDLQDKDFYKVHTSEINAAWTSVEDKMLNPIKNWILENNITSKNDSMTLFYPFSGPDFLFANAFFPYCREYIFFGLENPGKIPQMSNLQDTTIKAYLENLRISLQSTNQNGFFHTKKMKEIFKNVFFDGAIHIILFYISKTGYDVTDFQPFFLDEFGNVVNQEKIIVTDKKVQGIKISFRDTTNTKDLYYFQLDVSNANLIENLEFIYFLNNFKNKVTYMKSASYLLQEDRFSMIRDITLKQSYKILQDDTGIPFEKIKSGNYDLEIYGNYTKTVSLFSARYQSDLRDAVTGQFKKSDLPFNLGYNAQFNETVLIYAKNNKLCAKQLDTEEEKGAEFNEVIYKVQVKILWDKVSFDDKMFEGLPDVDYYYDGSYYKYTIGKEKTETACKYLLDLGVSKGYKDAFVVAFYQGNRITLEEAAEILENK